MAALARARVSEIDRVCRVDPNAAVFLGIATEDGAAVAEAMDEAIMTHFMEARGWTPAQCPSVYGVMDSDDPLPRLALIMVAFYMEEGFARHFLFDRPLQQELNPGGAHAWHQYLVTRIPALEAARTRDDLRRELRLLVDAYLMAVPPVLQ